MNKKVRAFEEYLVWNEYESPKKMRFYLRRLENESIRSMITKSNSMKSEGELAKGINPSDD